LVDIESNLVVSCFRNILNGNNFKTTFTWLEQTSLDRRVELSSYLDYVNNVIVVNCCAAEVSSPTELHGFVIYSTATIAKIEFR